LTGPKVTMTIDVINRALKIELTSPNNVANIIQIACKDKSMRRRALTKGRDFDQFLSSTTLSASGRSSAAIRDSARYFKGARRFSATFSCLASGSVRCINCATQHRLLTCDSADKTRRNSIHARVLCAFVEFIASG